MSNQSKKYFVDTNIIIDLLGKRNPYFESAFDLFTLAVEKKIEVYVSSVTYCTVYYILRKKLPHSKLMMTFDTLNKYVKILNVNDTVIKNSIVSNFDDFEDAIQYHCACLQKGIAAIITRDRKGFRNCKLSVLTAEEYLKTIH